MSDFCFYVIMDKLARVLIKVSIILIFTIFTQIGGLIFIIIELLSKRFKISKLGKIFFFVMIYFIVTTVCIPLVAPSFGRVKIKNTSLIHPANYMTVLLNRNYIKPELYSVLIDLEKKLIGTGISVNYLDANFPFTDGFPLLPHLSHNDGEKIDLSLVYEDYSGEISGKQKSVSGYGVFEGPNKDEYHQPNICVSKGYLQYDYPKYLTFGIVNKNLRFSVKGTKELIELILQDTRVGKLFIEPHLKKRLDLIDDRVRYHGCRAVRHDDHIHIQLRKSSKF